MHNNLYVFSHIPKTGGAYIASSLKIETQKHQILNAGYTYSKLFTNLTTQRREYYTGKEHFFNYINSLSHKDKEQIEYIEGHDAFYGIHHQIKPKAKYITFFRDPIARTLSLYNYERMMWEKLADKEDLNYFMRMFKTRIIKNFLIEEQIPDFEIWLDQVYKKNHLFYSSMSDYLQYLQFIDDKRDEASFSQALKKFHFVGITEQYSTDSAYLFHLFNIKNPSGIPNKATPYVTMDLISPSILGKIKDLNSHDLILYQCALRENERFKKQSKEYCF
jgi:hypothetical protein